MSPQKRDPMRIRFRETSEQNFYNVSVFHLRSRTHVNYVMRATARGKMKRGVSRATISRAKPKATVSAKEQFLWSKNRVQHHLPKFSTPAGTLAEFFAQESKVN